MVDSPTKNGLFYGDEILISKIGEIKVRHPRFGLINRMGWGFTKKGNKMSFFNRK